MSSFGFYHPIEVRYGDLDPQGHVNNARYLTYFEQARVRYFRSLGLWDGRSFERIGVILADAHISYKAPALLGQDIRVGVRISRLGNKSFTMEYRMEEAETGLELATGETVMVAFDYSAGKTMPIPDAWREIIMAFEGMDPNDRLAARSAEGTER